MQVGAIVKNEMQPESRLPTFFFSCIPFLNKEVRGRHNYQPRVLKGWESARIGSAQRTLTTYLNDSREGHGEESMSATHLSDGKGLRHTTPLEHQQGHWVVTSRPLGDDQCSQNLTHAHCVLHRISLLDTDVDAGAKKWDLKRICRGSKSQQGEQSSHLKTEEMT